MAEHSITHFYKHDHDRLDELFRSFQRLKHTDFAKAGGWFREFRTGLQRHIIWEEEILFPLFERKTGMTVEGPTQAMRREHGIIKAYLDEIYEQVRLRSPDTDEAERKLIEALSSHNMNEERILYPAIDGCLEKDERSHVFRSMEGLSEARHTEPPPASADS